VTIDLVEQLDALGYDEFWCGEHHSSGWETIASPEMFLAAAGERTKRIRLGTGVVSLPYHHPFNVAQAMVQLGPHEEAAPSSALSGALASDAHTLGIDPMTQRDRQDERSRSFAGCSRANASPPKATVHHERRGAADSAAAGRDAVRGGVADSHRA